MIKQKKLKILVITNLFPNNKEPNRGIFIKQAVHELARLCELQVVAPVPWMPKICSAQYIYADINQIEFIDGIKVYHPRWLVTPKICRSIYGFLFYLSLLRNIKKIQQDFYFDVIYAPWVYPDGFGSVLLGKCLNKPVILHALGCDVNQYTKYFIRRHLIAWALGKAKFIISVSKAIKDTIIKLGIRCDQIFVIPTGVNTAVFRNIDKTQCRHELGLSDDEKIILFVGSFEHVKGINYLLEAFVLFIRRYIPHVRLIMIGKGNMKAEIITFIEQNKLQQCVTIVGEVDHDNISTWMNAADIFCLPSIREGTPNVILEALACGKPIVATSVGGIPDILNRSGESILVPPRDAQSLAGAFERIFATSNEWKCFNVSAKVVSWKEHAEMIFDILKNAT